MDKRNDFDIAKFNKYREGNRLEVKSAKGGLPGIFAVWDAQGWVAPTVEEQYNPDRTILTLSFEAKQAETPKRQNAKPTKCRNGCRIGRRLGG